MRKKLMVLAALAALSAFSLGALSVAAQDEQEFTIGISNSFVSSEWRTQMIQNFEETAAELSEDPELGVEIELVIESEDTDAAGQEQQI